jgi:hypothetical protein
MYYEVSSHATSRNCAATPVLFVSDEISMRLVEWTPLHMTPRIFAASLENVPRTASYPVHDWERLEGNYEVPRAPRHQNYAKALFKIDEGPGRR